MSFGRRGGERRLARATNARAPGAGDTCSQALRRRVLHSVRRPVHVNPHYASGASSMVGRWRWHRGWANHASGRNQHRGHRKRTERGSPRVDAPAREAARHVREGRRSRPPSLRGSRARVWLLARRMYVAEVSRRRLVSNKLGKRAPKRAAGSSEQGPSSSRLSAGETAGGSRRAKRRLAVSGLTRTWMGEDRDKAQGGERSSSSGHTIAKSGELVAGPGL
jgi:hypothetical protein